MAEDIRPGYYKQAGELGKDALRLLGYTDAHLELECRIAWAKLRHNSCGELTHAIKYLWRAGKKGDAAEDLAKAHFWLGEAARDRGRIDRTDGLLERGQREVLPEFSSIWLAKEKVNELLEKV
jgi:hypothetical protein